MRALAAANKFIREKPAEALEIRQEALRQDGSAVLETAWKTVSEAHAKDIRVTVPSLDNSQKVSLEAKLLDDKDALKSFDGLFTDEFVR